MTKTELIEEIEAALELNKKMITAIENGSKPPFTLSHSKDHYSGRIEMLEEILISVKLLGRTVFGSRAPRRR